MNTPAKVDQTNAYFDIVLKVVERCNLNCPYCYYFNQAYDGNKNAPQMSDRVISELPRFLRRSVEKLNLAKLNIGLHGGEPLLMSKKRADNLCTRIRELEDTVSISFSLQTNGVRIDDEWVDIFAKHQINVGVSIDGNKELHDSKRPDHFGRGSYEAAVRGLRLLQEAVAQGRLRSAGVLCVVHATADSEKLLEHIVSELGVRSPSLNFPHSGWDNPATVEWSRQVESHRKIIRYWLDNLVYPEFHHVRSISDVLLALSSDEGARRKDRWNSRRHYIATISSEGVVHVDDNLLGVDTSLQNSELTIWDTSLADLVSTPLWQELDEAVDHLPTECESCEWCRSCRGGHLFNRFSRQSRFRRKSVLCDTIKMIHEEIAGYLVRKRVVKLKELADRLSNPISVTARGEFESLMSKPSVEEPAAMLL
ncbi:MAG: hypothetical protein DME97_05460 [Verrucomicrobia bacterium]|nr:MAG: hypothetical protein DME97_05460 [Verrucomicrobiota bacterium]